MNSGPPRGWRWREGCSALGDRFAYAAPLMPRIDEQVLRSIAYLYPTEADAWAGEKAGGSGFVAWVLGPNEPQIGHYYVVTASHVVREGNSPVVRFNTPDGKTNVFPFPLEAWYHHPDGDDIAIAAVPIDDFFRLSLTGVPPQLFVDADVMRTENFGPGDECFFVGRFMAHDGAERNLPTVRFGNVSTALTKVPHDRGFDQESFLVEARSLSGYSGSPVFVYTAGMLDETATAYVPMSSHVYLLGVDWAHLHDFAPVFEKDKETLVEPRLYIKQNAGMLAVVPAWKICDLLCDEER